MNRSRGGEDEAGTVRLLKSHTQALSELVGKFDGRVVDSAGDCLLAEFASVVDAVHCALEIQQGLQSRNGSSGCPRAEEYASPGPQSKEKFRQAVEMAEKVRTMDPSYYGPCMILALIQVREKRFDEALAKARKCYELEPNYINSIYIPGHVLTYVGKEEAEEAIGLIKEVFEPAPFPRLTTH